MAEDWIMLAVMGFVIGGVVVGYWINATRWTRSHTDNNELQTINHNLVTLDDQQERILAELAVVKRRLNKINAMLQGVVVDLARFSSQPSLDKLEELRLFSETVQNIVAASNNYNPTSPTSEPAPSFLEEDEDEFYDPRGEYADTAYTTPILTAEERLALRKSHDVPDAPNTPDDPRLAVIAPPDDDHDDDWLA